MGADGKAKEILEHVCLAGIIEERKNSKPAVTLDDLLVAEGLRCDDLGSSAYSDMSFGAEACQRSERLCKSWNKVR